MHIIQTPLHVTKAYIKDMNFVFTSFDFLAYMQKDFYKKRNSALPRQASLYRPCLNL